MHEVVTRNGWRAEKYVKRKKKPSWKKSKSVVTAHTPHLAASARALATCYRNSACASVGRDNIIASAFSAATLAATLAAASRTFATSSSITTPSRFF